MTATAHALVAGFIASKIPDPVLATTLSFSSHFVMDAIPHWDIGTNWRTRAKSVTGILAVCDTVIGITVTYFVFYGKVPFLVLTLAMIASLLPDWLETPWYIFFAHPKKHAPSDNAGFLEKFAYKIYKTENLFHTKAQFPFGLLTQIATVLFFLVLLK